MAQNSRKLNLIGHHMKHNFLFLILSFISFESHSMERLAPLRALPVTDDRGSAIDLPNPPRSAPEMFIRLTQNPVSKAQLELPLIEAKIKSLEKKHEKAKKAFNGKQEKIVDHALAAAGYIGSIYVIKHLYEYHTNGQYFYVSQHLLNFVSWPWLHDNLQFGGVAIAMPAFLALKNFAQAGTDYYKLPNKPQEPQELLDARAQKAQLLLTLQQSAQD